MNKGGGFFDILAADVQHDRLPSVSWIVAPEAYTEHPAWPAGYGAWYTAGVLNALTSNPDVWSKTALIITFDENDGFFDHVPGPYPNAGGLPGASTVPLDNELFAGQPGTPKGSGGVPGPYGLGIRVPLLVVSPWSSGGWVSSETFDHSSLIRLIEARFGVHEPNITPWRRAVCGDLTSAFDFESSSPRVPRLPSVDGYKPNETTTPPSYHPLPPAVGRVPAQEPGVRPSRRLGYRIDVGFDADPHKLNVAIANRGELGAGLQARSLTVPGAPYTYTVGAGDQLTAALPNPGTYDLSLHGPNGFFRHFAGSPATELRVEADADHRRGRLTLRIADAHRDRRRKRPLVLEVADAYGPDRKLELRGDGEISVDAGHAGGWYDIALTTPADPTFRHQLAGRLESTGQLTSDPQLGRTA